MILADSVKFSNIAATSSISISGTSQTFASLHNNELTISPDLTIDPGSYELTINTIDFVTSSVILIDTFQITVIAEELSTVTEVISYKPRFLNEPPSFYRLIEGEAF